MATKTNDIKRYKSGTRVKWTSKKGELLKGRVIAYEQGVNGEWVHMNVAEPKAPAEIRKARPSQIVAY